MRGLITAYSAGAPSSFWRKPINPASASNGLYTYQDYRGDQGIDSRYVDGFSVTRYNDAQRSRSHIFTLAVGFARSATVDFSQDGINKALEGNCRCHGRPHRPPAWMNETLYYCDAATDVEWDTGWQTTHVLFSETQACVKDQLGSAAYWEKAGLLPGQWLVEDLPQSTDAIEVRIMGSPIYTADVGIKQVKLEVFGIRSAKVAAPFPSRPEKVTLLEPYLATTTQSPQQLFTPPPTVHVLDQRNLRSSIGAFQCQVDWKDKAQAAKNGWTLLGTLARTSDGIATFTGLQTVGVYDAEFELVFSCEIGFGVCTDNTFSPAACSVKRVSSYTARVKVRRCYAGEGIVQESRDVLTHDVRDPRLCVPCDSASPPDDPRHCANHTIYFAVAGRCDLGPSDASSDTELQVCWNGFENSGTTNGTVQSYEIGIGSERGLTDLMAFTFVSLNTSALIHASELKTRIGALAGKLAVGLPYFATVRLTNIAGVKVTFPAASATKPRAGSSIDFPEMFCNLTRSVSPSFVYLCRGYTIMQLQTLSESAFCFRCPGAGEKEGRSPVQQIWLYKTSTPSQHCLMVRSWSIRGKTAAARLLIAWLQLANFSRNPAR